MLWITGKLTSLAAKIVPAETKHDEAQIGGSNLEGSWQSPRYREGLRRSSGTSGTVSQEIFNVNGQKLRAAWQVPGIQFTAFHSSLDGADRYPKQLGDIMKGIRSFQG
jgi:hypothetical protein